MKAVVSASKEASIAEISAIIKRQHLKLREWVNLLELKHLRC